MRDDHPAHWKVKRLSEVAKRVSRNGADVEAPLMTISAKSGFILQSDKYSRVMAGLSAERYTLMKKGEFAYNKGNSLTSPQGCIFQLEENLAKVPFVYYCFDLNEEINRDFAHHAFRTGILNRQLARVINSGVRNDGLLNLYVKDFFGCKLVLPSLPEQRLIAEVLSAVELSICRVIKLIATIKDSQIEYSRNLVGTEENRLWPVRPLGSMIQKCQYGLSIPLDGDGTVPVLRMPDIKDGRVNVERKTLKSTDVTAREIEDYQIREGEVLFNRTNSQALVGKTGIVRCTPAEPIVFASYLIRLITKPDINPYWLNAFLNLPRTQERLKTLATPGVSQWNINAKTLKRFLVPVLPKATQDKFADFYEAVELRLERERSMLQALNETKKALAQELLSGRLPLPQSMIDRFENTTGKSA